MEFLEDINEFYFTYYTYVKKIELKSSFRIKFFGLNNYSLENFQSHLGPTIIYQFIPLIPRVSIFYDVHMAMNSLGHMMPFMVFCIHCKGGMISWFMINYTLFFFPHYRHLNTMWTLSFLRMQFQPL